MLQLPTVRCYVDPLVQQDLSHPALPPQSKLCIQRRLLLPVGQTTHALPGKGQELQGKGQTTLEQTPRERPGRGQTTHQLPGQGQTISELPGKRHNLQCKDQTTLGKTPHTRPGKGQTTHQLPGQGQTTLDQKTRALPVHGPTDRACQTLSWQLVVV